MGGCASTPATNEGSNASSELALPPSSGVAASAALVAQKTVNDAPIHVASAGGQQALNGKSENTATNGVPTPNSCSTDKDKPTISTQDVHVVNESQQPRPAVAQAPAGGPEMPSHAGPETNNSSSVREQPMELPPSSISQTGSQLGEDVIKSDGSNPQSTWDKAKMLFQLTKPEELLNDLHDLKYIGAGGYGKVFKAVWRSAPVAVKLVPSHSPELFKSSSYKEALLCKELCHPNIVQTYETRCAQLTDEFVHSILSATESPLQAQKMMAGAAGGAGAASYTSQEFVSGDGFGLPSPVPDMVVKGKTLPEAAGKWKDILFTTGAKAGDYLTVIIMDFCDYGSLVRPIMKGMFRPFSASGSDREARVRYRALLRTAKEIAQGLEHLHYLKVVHGDLKPGNVLLKGSRGDVRGFNAQVIDFGLSHMVNNSNPQKVSKAGGTLVYAAPEVFSGRVGKAADVYSLGIILWEMVTGSQPYKDMVEGQIVLGVQKGGLRPAWPAGQLPQLQELYERCVAQDPDSRPKAKEVVQFLTQIEMDLRSELRAAHKQAQATQMAQAAQLQQHVQLQHMQQQQQQQQAMQQQQQQVAMGL